MNRLVALMICAISLGALAQTTCVDPLACNFTQLGECEFLDDDGQPCVLEGCNIEGACNFNPEADINDGSCEFESCIGCTDELACNYDSNALYLDSSCIYFVDCNGVCGDWIEDDCGNCYSPQPASDTLLFLPNGSIDEFIVPENIIQLEIVVAGAQGGQNPSCDAGGLGAVLSAKFQCRQDNC